jgi:GxxExxY protein
MELNDLTEKIIGCAITVHRALGPGLIESAYEVCLAHEINKQGFDVQTQVALPVIYDSIKLDAGYRLDLLVEKRVVIELKAVERLIPIHEAQLLSYLKLSKLPIGLLINFNVRLLRDGIRRLVN